MTSDEPNGQLLKPLKFKYWIVPLSKQVDYFKLFDYSDYLAKEIKSIQFRKQDIDIFASKTDRTLSVQQGCLDVKNAVMTSLRKHQGGVQVRMFNPYYTEQTAEIGLLSCEMTKFKTAVSVDFEGNACDGPVNIADGQFKIKMKPKQIITLCLKRKDD